MKIPGIFVQNMYVGFIVLNVKWGYSGLLISCLRLYNCIGFSIGVFV